MDNLIQWSVAVEKAAAATYRLAAEHFAGQPAFAAFLGELAAEEEWHAALLAAADAVPRPATTILPEQATCDKILQLFEETSTRLRRGEMSQDEMSRTIVAVEFSEWNEFFLYAIGALRGSANEFALAVAEIEQHKERIVEFFSSFPDGRRYLDVVYDLPGTGGKRILLIERRAPLAAQLRRALAPIGEVVLAESGDEGLARIAQQPFDVILSDVDMGTMDSFEFYRRAVSVDPAIALRCVFFAGGEGGSAMPAELPAEQIFGKPAFVEQLCRTVAGVARGNGSRH